MIDNHTKRARAVLYARVSSEEQREGQTIDSQLNELKNLAKVKEWHLIGVYKDEGWTGSVLARPELDRLRDDASKGLFDLVLVNDVDRLARDVTHLGIIKRDLERHGVRLIFKKLPDENSPTHNLMVNILGSFAEFERQMIADRTRRGTRYKVEVRQQYLGGLTPYGFRYQPKDRSAGRDGYLEVVAEEAAVVRNMFTWVDDEGLSARKVTERLTQLKIRPRKKGQSWARSSVLRILHCEMYVGVWHYNKHQACEPFKPRTPARYRTPKSSQRLRPKSEWLPVTLPDHLRIIDHKQWERVQNRLGENIAFSPRNSKHIYLLKGLIRCGGCSQSYVGDPSHGRFYYRCLARCKKVPSITEEILNDVVWGAVLEAILNPNIIMDQIDRLAQKKNSEAKEGEREANEIKAAMQQIKIEEERLLEAYRNGILPPTLLGEELGRLNARKATLQAREAALSQHIPQTEMRDIRISVKHYCDIAATRIESFTFEERQRFLRLLIRSIIFEGDHVRIRSVIPFQPDRNSGTSRLHADNEALVGVANHYERRITPTMVESSGRSPAGNSKGFLDGEPDENPKYFEFSLDKPIVSGKESSWWLKQKRGPDGRYRSQNPPPHLF